MTAATRHWNAASPAAADTGQRGDGRSGHGAGPAWPCARETAEHECRAAAIRLATAPAKVAAHTASTVRYPTRGQSGEREREQGRGPPKKISAVQLASLRARSIADS
jgi:hypothetical protein